MLINIVLFNSFTKESVDLGVFSTIDDLSTTFPVSLNGNDLALYGRNADEWEVSFFRLSEIDERQELPYDPRKFLEDLANPIDFL